jgi:hypothetical protein
MVHKDGILLTLQEFFRCKSVPNFYVVRTTDSLLIPNLYVDDILITNNSVSTISSVKGIIHDRFSMTDMGPLHLFLGLEIIQDASGIKIYHAKYARDIIERFHMKYYKSTPTPFLFWVRLEDGHDTPVVENTLYRQLVGCLLYLTQT